jgi:hypothetical protein
MTMRRFLAAVVSRPRVSCWHIPDIRAATGGVRHPVTGSKSPSRPPAPAPAPRVNLSQGELWTAIQRGLCAAAKSLHDCG